MAQYGGNQHPRVMWMVKKTSNLKYTIRDDLWKDNDASIMDITRGRTTLRLINVYNQKLGHDQGWCLTRWPSDIIKGQETVFMGDMNAHSPVWDEMADDTREEMVLDIAQEEGLQLLNELNRVTWRRNNRASVLDLTWATPEVAQRTNWSIKENMDTGSDHAVIQIDIRTHPEYVTPATARKFNFKKADWPAVQNEAQKQVEAMKEEWKRSVDNNDPEELARLLETTLIKAIEAGIPVLKSSPRSKPWFDEEVKEARKAMARLGRWKNQRRGEAPEETTHWKAARARYFRMIREKKKEMWNKFVEEAEGKDIWNVWRYATNQRRTKTPTLETEDGIATTFKEKETVFLQHLFPKAPQDREQAKPPCSTQEPFETITEQEAHRAISTQSSLKAPGPDDIPFAVIKQCWSVVGELITEAYNTMLRQGYHPKRWRKAVGAIIPKPNKGDYTKPKAHRPISLLNTLGKGLERICAERLTTFGETKGALSDQQWGGRKGRSAEECVEHTLDWCREREEEGKKVILVATDIAQAFPNVSKTKLANTLREGGANEQIAAWTTSFMKDRQVRLRFDGDQGEWNTIDTGIPQGSPASPILFNLHIAPLLHELAETTKKRHSGEAITPTFIDDLTYAVAGEDWCEAMERAEALIEQAEDWATKNDVKFDKEKTEWIRLGCKGEEQYDLLLPGGSYKKETKCMRWLGVWIDRKLNFTEHVDIKIAKGKNVLRSMRGMGKGKRGMGIGNLRTMYIACARVTMEYGGRVWWKGQKNLSGKMDKEDRAAMRKLGGHFRTAPGEAVAVENDIIPTEAHLNERARRNVVKALMKPPSHPSHKSAVKEINRITQEDDSYGERKKGEKKGEERGMRGAVKLLGKIGRKDIWRKKEVWTKLWSKEEVWEKEIREGMVVRIEELTEEEKKRQRKRKEEKGEVVIFADGSKSKNGCGVGLARIDNQGSTTTKGHKLGPSLTIFDLEMIGINLAVEMGLKVARKEGLKCITIRTDSQQAMRRVVERAPTCGEAVARKIRWNIDAAKTNGIATKLEWVKGHSGILGNELADKAAKEAAVKTGAINKTQDFISFAHLQQTIKETTIREWDRLFVNNPEQIGRQYLTFPNRRHLTKFGKNQRKEKITISRLRTGHIHINEYKKRTGKIDNDMCECGGGAQTVYHVLLECMFAHYSRQDAIRELEQINKRILLYSQEGIPHAINIWNEFEDVRKRMEGLGRENEGMEENAEAGWGWGQLERD